MKLTSMIARYLLGLIFTVFGLNGFFNFLPPPPPPSPLAGQFISVMVTSHWMLAVALFQLISGLFLLANRFVPLALAMLAPIIVNILLYHVLIDPPGLGPGIVVTILWALVFMSVRSSFRGLFLAKAPADG